MSTIIRLVTIAAAVGAVSCGPVFQDARIVAPGTVEVTPSVSGAAVTNGGTHYVGEAYAVTALVGTWERSDFGVAYVRTVVDDADGGLNSLVFGPRVGIVKDRFAVAVPFSFFFGEDVPVSRTWAVHPTALFTLPMGEHLDFNPSVRMVVSFEEPDTILGFNAGFGIHVHPAMTIRPEFGILVNPGEDGVAWSFGIGFSARTR